MPEDGPVGDGGAIHALTRGRRGGPVQCFCCQETGHVVANCPHCAQGTSAPGAILTTTCQACHTSEPTPVHKKWRAQWMSPDALRRPQLRSAAWKPAPRNFSSCVGAWTWSVLGSLELQQRSARPGRYTPCCCHMCHPVSTKSWQAMTMSYRWRAPWRQLVVVK